MRLRRRQFLALPAVGSLSCVTLPNTQPPEDWVQVGFGRYTVRVPPGMLRDYDVWLQLDGFTGHEHGNSEETFQQWSEIRDEDFDTRSLYLRKDGPYILLEDDFRKDIRLHSITRRTETSQRTWTSILVETGEVSLLLEAGDTDGHKSTLEEKIEDFLQMLQPSSVARTMPGAFQTPHLLHESACPLWGTDHRRPGTANPLAPPRVRTRRGPSTSR